jgi:hypothetical protein
MRIVAILFLLPLVGLAGRAAVPEPLLYRSRLALAPTDNQLASLPPFVPRWVFSGEVAAGLAGYLVTRGFRPEFAAELQSRLVAVPGAEENILIPDRGLLARFVPRERSEWRLLLAYHHANDTYRWPLSLGPAELAALDAGPRWREAMSRLRASAEPHGDRLVFADLFALEDTFATAADRRDFYRLALHSDGLLLKLLRDGDRPLDVQAQSDYWLVNGRYRAIEPMLNAVASIPNAPRLDVAHLLPRLPRALLNTFPPHLADAEDPGIESSLLASDFFALSPGADAAAPGGFKGWLERECVPADGPPQYGDLLVYGDLHRTSWPYAAVYIAGGVGFARRPTYAGPWQFIELADIGRLNPRFAGLVPRVYRSRGVQIAAGTPPFLPSRAPAAWRQQLQLKAVKPGPWGRLWYYDVLLAPSGNTLERLPPPSADPVWTFAGLSLEQILEAVRQVEMPATVRRDLETLFQAARPDPEGRLTVHPSLGLVLAVPRELRTRLFPKLVGGTSITDYTQHIPFPAGFTVDEWFDTGSLPETVRQAMLRLVYPAGDRVMLSDFGALFHLLGTRAEQLSAHRAALRVPGIVVLLEKPAPAEVPALANYWRPGRHKNIAALLHSFAVNADNNRFIDIIHLLSPIEREFLNTYFNPTGPSLTPSCFWAAFNFGVEKPDDRYLVLPGTWSEHEQMAWRELTANFDAIAAPAQLGDIIGYRRKDAAAIVHVAIFIADGLVYTKNGETFSQPWCLSRLADLDELYLTDPGMERVYFRRRPSRNDTAPPSP